MLLLERAACPKLLIICPSHAGSMAYSGTICTPYRQTGSTTGPGQRRQAARAPGRGGSSFCWSLLRNAVAICSLGNVPTTRDVPSWELASTVYVPS